MSKKTITNFIEKTTEFTVCDKCGHTIDIGNTRPFMYEFLPKEKDLCDPCFMGIIREGIDSVFPPKDQGKDNV